MKHAILLLWHKDIEQLKNLIRLFDEDFKFYIHIDKKSIITKEEIERLKNNCQIAGVYQKYRINWGGFNILKAELLLLQEIVKNNSIDYIHFMSGQDYPIKKLDDIKSFFKNNNGREFIEYMKLPVEKWEYGTYDRFVYYRLNDWFDYNTCKGYKIIEKFITLQKRIGYKRRIPDQFEHLYGGSNWMSITYECAKHMTENKRKFRRFYNRLKYTFAADEVYFHTVILNSIFADKVENNNQRCILWDGKCSPIDLNETHWWKIINSNRLFARKLDYKVSAKLMECINRHLFTNDETKDMKDIVVIVAHEMHKSINEKYFRIKEGFKKYGDVVLLLNHEDESEIHFPEGMDYCIFTTDMLNELKYEPIEETITPGSNHFALLYFYLKHSGYRHYWNIEYDVEFSGEWTVLFDGFSDINTDFISTHIMGYEEEKEWFWWNSYQGKTMDIPLGERLRSFNPIYRISEKALKFLDEFLKAQNCGHHEVLIPSSLFHSGFTIADFGGTGRFVLPGYENRFYLSTDLFCEKYPGGTMRCFPQFHDIKSYHLSNKLFHPLKYSE